MNTALSACKLRASPPMIAAAVLILAASVTYVVAQIPAQDGVITGCYHASNGSLRVIDAEGGETCKGNEIELAWNQKGPAGPEGPEGPEGAEGPQGPAGAAVQPHRIWVGSLRFSALLTESYSVGILALNPGEETVTVNIRRFDDQGSFGFMENPPVVPPGSIGGIGFSGPEVGSGWIFIEADGPILPSVSVSLRETDSLNPKAMASVILNPVDCDRPAGFEFVCEELRLFDD